MNDNSYPKISRKRFTLLMLAGGVTLGMRTFAQVASPAARVTAEPDGRYPGAGDGSEWATKAADNGWEIGTWAAISGPTPSHGLSATNVLRDVKSVDPGSAQLQGIIGNWAGGAYAPRLGANGSLIVGPGGGHGGYSDNDVFRFDIATRTWSELRAASKGGLDELYGEYPDGSPGAYHTYFQAAATGALPGYPRGILILPKSITSQKGQTPDVSVPYPHFLDLARPESGWVRLDAIPDPGRKAWRYACAGFWDDSRNVYWLWAINRPPGQNVLATLDPLAPSGSQWIDYRPATKYGTHYWWGSNIEQVVVRDPRHDIAVTINWRGDSDSIKYLPLDAPDDFLEDYGPTLWPIRETGTPPPRKTEGGGFDYSPTHRAAIWWGGAESAEVWKLEYERGKIGSRGTAGSLTYRWTPLLNREANKVVPSDQVQNPAKIYNRFRIVTLPSGVEFATAVTHVGGYPKNGDGAVYAFRLK